MTLPLFSEPTSRRSAHRRPLAPRHRCTVRHTHARGNQHLRIEYGVCHCGQKYSRTIRWAERDARRWWEPVAR